MHDRMITRKPVTGPFAALAKVLLGTLFALAASAAWAQAPAVIENGAEVHLAGTDGIFRTTRLWFLGNRDHVTRIYFLLHGDGIVDYSDATVEDRREMEAALPKGEGALLAYPISCGERSWPAFTGGPLQRVNGPVIVSMFNQLAALVHNEDASFEQFALSGAGKVNMALLCLVMEKYDSDPDVHRFVDRNLRGIHDGAALCYDAYSMVTAYYDVLTKHPAVRATFIHNTQEGEEVDYGYLYHFKVAELLEDGMTEQRFPKGGSLSLQNGRIRFWSEPLHINTWKTQFRQVLLRSDLPAPIIPQG
ncbi:MAG TPA: hypothetical protein VN436_16495 [Holophaga sp.]|nr:hypothetical protein [Holophaga sp.]